ncbi:Endolytic murein transglycosylase [Neolewinella maritima]|uniref:Endolytic murein transglycosylase n=1 Tax=Neolewinella maritima TaxID=1383882 RepID=A0ABN8EZL2_9BACT|nr:endolytic transglycosylase MltG [Neolewinella maritima]CAH0998847.1 Endolytic murein transglycosylase [Neolewinella maritima]
MKQLIALLILVVLAVLGYAYYEVMVRPVVPEGGDPVAIEIPTGSSYEQVMDSLAVHGITPNRLFFDPLAERMEFNRPRMRAGRFTLAPGTSSVGLIRKLRSGAQATVDVVLTTEREPMNVAAKVARFLEPDSLAFQQLFQDTAFIDSIGFTPETLQTLFIPNTYEMYWNATPREFVARMVKEHERFWRANDRMAKAAARDLSPAEVYTLASIVEKESLQATERPRIAGVYLNRIRIGMPLQADPTAVFATREFDVGRVLNRHIEFDNPYNTYVYRGLPPGPITMSSVGSIDAVLSPEQHDYLYFCARGDGSGLHNFASTLGGHSRNIAIYVANLKLRGIR